MELALLCGMTDARASELSRLLSFAGIRVHRTADDELDTSVRKVLDGGKSVPEGPVLPLDEEMLVLKVSERRVSDVLNRFHRFKVKKPELMALVTETNAEWTLRTLAQELSREREAFRSGSSAHEPEMNP